MGDVGAHGAFPEQTCSVKHSKNNDIGTSEAGGFDGNPPDEDGEDF
jgi:hypothetical protein